MFALTIPPLMIAYLLRRILYAVPILIGVNLLGISTSAYFGEMKTYIEMKDIIGGLYKSLCFGIIVTWICNYKGFHAGYGAEGVSRATTQAVVLCSVLILISDYLVTSIYF